MTNSPSQKKGNGNGQSGADSTGKSTSLLPEQQIIQVRSMILSYIITASVGIIATLGCFAMFYLNYKVDSKIVEINNEVVKAKSIVSEMEKLRQEQQEKLKRDLPLIGVLTDFGPGSYYIGNFRGKIMTSYPEAEIIDISHQIKPFDTTEGAWILYNASKSFPEGSIFLAIVNPGADLKEGLLIETKSPKYYFVGAGLGLFDHVTEHFGLEGAYRVQLTAEDDTFGTEIFSKVIKAFLRNHSIEGLKSNNLISDKIAYTATLKSALNKVVFNGSGNTVKGCVCSVDRWGNLLTNIEPTDFFRPGRTYSIKIKDIELKGFVYVKSYSNGANNPGVLIRQDGWVQIAIYKGSANDKFGLNNSTEEVIISLESN